MAPRVFYLVCSHLDNKSLCNLLSTCKKFYNLRIKEAVLKIFRDHVDPVSVTRLMHAAGCGNEYTVDHAKEKIFEIQKSLTPESKPVRDQLKVVGTLHIARKAAYEELIGLEIVRLHPLKKPFRKYN